MKTLPSRSLLLTLLGALMLLGTPATAQSVPFSPFVPFEVRVNFQPASAPVPAGFVADSGQVYGNRGNGYTYGWSADNTANTRDRNNPGVPSQAYDTVIRTQNGSNFTWELAVPPGYYRVRLVAGDPDFIDSDYRFTLDTYGDVPMGTPTEAQHFFENVLTVAVTDGRLTIGNDVMAVNNKLAFVEVKRMFGANINFQPATSTPLTDMPHLLSDTGQVYGARAHGLTFGWNVDNTANMVEAGSGYILFRRHARMQQGGDRVWEIAVPNGVYHVTITAGDLTTTAGAYRIQVEDTVVLSAIPSPSGIATREAMVAVLDGKLTMRSAPGAANNKVVTISFMQQ